MNKDVKFCTKEFTMNLEKFSPWNWFKKEEEENTEIVPVRRYEGGLVRPSSLLELHREFDRLFESLWRGFGSEWPPPFPRVEPRSKSEWFKPSLDVVSDEKEYNINIELPGIDADDVNIELEGNTLKIKGEKRQQTEEKEKDFYRVERSYGAFQRTLDLPEDADRENIASTYKDGVLRVTVPRKALPKKETKKIDIKIGS